MVVFDIGCICSRAAGVGSRGGRIVFRLTVGFDGVTGGWANDGRATFRMDVVLVSSDFTSAKDGGCRRRPTGLESVCR